MTSFARTDEQRMLAEMLDSTLSDDTDWQGAVDATGLVALGIPAEEEGLGSDLRDAAVVAAALGRANVVMPWAEHWVATRLGARGEAGPRAEAPAAALTGAQDDEERAWAEDALTVLHCAEIVGLCRTMLRDAALFSKERKQFGVAIASFQALRHRMADMAMILEQADAITDLAIVAFDDDAAARTRAVSAARVICDDAARLVGEGAVQIHGAMGLTAELRLGGYFRRARVLAQGDGTARAHLRRYAA
ncbi:acyl-CoA dehydrogenase family protein [Sphingomonas dokdonensis]|uniref:Acyl-CoA dehydrogenase, short-chain specific n=1 Tax=Sphingomonas dokdonensis TaxID=344880 RepID=A0A245ZUN1_9SPHN|nr:acyl-CoA dehydrogenase family protein [Sphingomonas dokdonensis]OWK33442.1 acyl-CoA dehydrogenase, short-chain specific [Sphingomonas dokdonensis]